MSRRTAFLLLFLLPAGPALADRTQVYSIRKADCADCGTTVQTRLKKVKGIRKSSFDRNKVELTVTMADGVRDEQVVGAIQAAGLEGIVGAGKGAYLPHPDYPKGADVVVLTDSGSKVGSLEALRVPGKFTVFDFYAEWCGPCRVIDARLRKITGERTDVAVRKLDVVDFTSPLAKELGGRLTALPYVVVFSPDGRRTDIVGSNVPKLESALAAR